jgi:hypothetical protein
MSDSGQKCILILTTESVALFSAANPKAGDEFFPWTVKRNRS